MRADVKVWGERRDVYGGLRQPVPGWVLGDGAGSHMVYLMKLLATVGEMIPRLGIPLPVQWHHSVHDSKKNLLGFEGAARPTLYLGLDPDLALAMEKRVAVPLDALVLATMQLAKAGKEKQHGCCR